MVTADPEPDPDAHARLLAQASVSAADPIGWFDRLYLAAASGRAVVPWDRGEPHPLLARWLRARAPEGPGRRAMVVGCGPGWDAELIASAGFATHAFDVSPVAIREVRLRFPDSSVTYVTADLLDPPTEWAGAFDLVVEVMTVQSLPDPPRRDAVAQVARLLAPGGTLVVVAAAREECDPVDGPPWPLTRAEVDAFAARDVGAVRIELVRDAARPWIRRWCAEFRREATQPGAG
jgi:SAM-dependent methyltransferase